MAKTPDLLHPRRPRARHLRRLGDQRQSMGSAACSARADPREQDRAWPDRIAGYFSIVTTIFLHLIKMIIAPLVFSTLVVGIAHMGDTAALGRVGVKAVGWFICASLVSLTLGLILVNLLQPGVGARPAAAAGRRDERRRRRPPSTSRNFITHIFPQSMHRGDGEQRDPADRRLLAVRRRRDHRGRREGRAAGPRRSRRWSQVMLQITDYVMRFAPVRGVRRGDRDDRRARARRSSAPSAISWAASISAWSSCGRC